MVKHLLALYVALALAVAASGWLLVQRGRLTAQIAQIEVERSAALASVERNQATLAALRRKNAATARAGASAAASLAAASAANPSWASEPVPKGVQDALTQ